MIGIDPNQTVDPKRIEIGDGSQSARGEMMSDDIDAVLFVDRTNWPDGPWSNEPDRIEWKSATGFQCLAVRNSLGTWCGYVGVPPEHPWHGRDYDDIDADVHGGLTYARKCAGRICHRPSPGETEHRDVAYVRAETEKLAAQAMR